MPLNPSPWPRRRRVLREYVSTTANPSCVLRAVCQVVTQVIVYSNVLGSDMPWAAGEQLRCCPDNELVMRRCADPLRWFRCSMWWRHGS